MGRTVWERKFELDSLAYPIELAFDYWSATRDSLIFSAAFHDSLTTIVATLEVEQHHAARSTYRHSDLDDSAVGDTGMIWMVVDKTAAAKKVFAQHRWDTSEDEVLAVTLPDSPGSLGRFATKLGKAGVNITFAYTGSAGSARKTTAYFGVSDLKAALKVRA